MVTVWYGTLTLVTRLGFSESLVIVEDVCPSFYVRHLMSSLLETTEYSIMTTLAQDAEVEASTASNSYNDGSTASVTNSTDEFTGGTEKRTSVADSVRSSDTREASTPNPHRENLAIPFHLVTRLA